MVDHLLLYCECASEFWSLLFCLFGVQWVMLHRVLWCLATCWKGRYARQCCLDCSTFVPYVDSLEGV